LYRRFRRKNAGWQSNRQLRFHRKLWHPADRSFDAVGRLPAANLKKLYDDLAIVEQVRRNTLNDDGRNRATFVSGLALASNATRRSLCSL
jgi:hypothetical protein